MASQILRVIGRGLIITLLLTSAFIKIGNPSLYAANFELMYIKVKNLFPFFSILPPVNQFKPYMIRIIAGIGFLQGIGALLILFGDKLGGIIFTLFVVFSQISIKSYAMLQIIKLKNIGRILQMSTFICLLGIALMLCDTAYIRRKAKKY